MDKQTNTALLIIDIQNFYFPDGKWELENSEKAVNNAQKILNKFRESGMMVVHIKHNSEPGGEIHSLVAPIKDEKVITKNHVNSFKDTDLLDYLKTHKIEKLIICGMMTHMCVEAATRAAHDHGFECVVIEDACATKTLKFNDREISAINVHCSTLSTLSGSYAKVINTKTLLEE